MFTKEEKKKWIKYRLKLLPKLIKMIDTYYLGEMKEKETKEYEIEKEILKDAGNFYQETETFNLVVEDSEELEKMIEEFKKEGKPICIVRQTKPEDLTQ